ncbi:50S ribosomal protein L3 N(5)-glutamine methyltransferase [Variovorax sp. PCZ-1]|uniref:50S ribosomal protein L3 N(5)-glutamine methyltransferase n=1 Tax=Variovorax sp. PCZ-1 TaxID=2835533 RepID=UPI001BCE843B|nr:50S ribosomal protein L3 N(5)-glutamine methyltransferase [Variovorax sp. PCZ-1]
MSTVIQTIEEAALKLEAAGVGFGHGTTNAFDEAAWLVLWSLKLPLDSLDSEQNRPVSGIESAQIATLLRARIESRQPAAYLTNEAWLQGVPFYVDERVIVPRSFIAELIADADEQGTLDYWLREDTRNVLDLCTGNGSLAILAAMAFPEVRVHAADISPDALAVAAINVQKHALQDRIELIRSDGLAQCTGIAGQPYDLILCNPPYVNSASMAALPAEYLAEPEISLAGGADGMDFIRPLLKAAPQVMSEHAVLVLEIGNERPYFEQAFPRLRAVWLETSAGHDQVLLLERNTLLRDI